MKTLLFLFLTSALCFASAPQGEITSQSCADPKTGSRGGTGIVFRAPANGPEKTWMITADANVLHGNAGICHRIEWGGTSSPAKLVDVDWSRGLALLEFSPQGTAPELTALTPTTPRPGLRATVTTSNSPYRGRISVSATTRHDFPRFVRVHEWVGTDVQRLAIGAPVLDNAGNIVGLVSNRIIQIRPGQPSALVNWPASDPMARHLLLLDWEETRQWITDYFGKPGRRAPLIQKVADQLQGVEKLYSGNFVFSEIKPILDSKGIPSGDSPVGGGDGIGVGGGKKPSHGSKIVVAGRLTPGQDTLPSTLVARTKAVLAENTAAEFVLGYDLQLIGGDLEHITFSSLGNFFRIAYMGMKMPVVAKRIPHLAPRVHELASQVSLKISHYREWLAFGDEPTYRFIRLVYLSAKLLQSDLHGQISRADLVRLTDSKGEFGRVLGILASFPNEGKPLIHLLEQLRNELP